MKEEVKEALGHWNKFIQGFQLAREGWEEFSKMVGFGSLHLEEFPLEAQKALSRCNPKATFTVALPRFADYVRKYADVNEMVFPVEEEKLPLPEKPIPVIVSKKMKETAKEMIKKGE